MKTLTTKQTADLTIGLGVVFVMRYGVLGSGAPAEWSVMAGGLVLIAVGGIWRMRLNRRGF